ncbi:MAG: DUF5989 family protein [Pseudobdellovibrio sp.]
MNKIEMEPKKEGVPRTTFRFVVFIFKKIIEKKRYWLLPLWCLLAALAIILFLASNSVLLPAIYMAF